MLHLVAFGESVLTAGTLGALTPVPDQTVNISGNSLYIPAKPNMLALAAAIVGGSSSFTHAQLRSPSLRELFYVDLAPLIQGSNFSGADPVTDFRLSPIQLSTNEGMEFYSDGGGDGATAQNPYGLMWLSDGAIQKANGDIRTIRTTAANTLAANTWVNGALTFDQDLPVGNYDIVGMRAEGTGLKAARLVFKGGQANARPGTIGVASGQTVIDDMFRNGNMGVLGTFDTTTPPSIDTLGDTGTSQVVYLDLIKRG